ncbi:serine protease [Vibrio sp. FNV 38]|nr:serine protease [Vibrio sp. FNV 38]
MKQYTTLWPLALSCTLFSMPNFASTPSARIIDGESAADNAWPYIGALVQSGFSASDGQLCGASYLGGRYVLTAAHCVEGASPHDVELLFGVNDLDNENQGLRISVSNIYIHESFNSSQLLNDIAVLELPRALNSSEATPVTLSNQGRLNELYMQGDVTLTVAGWGTTAPNGPTVSPESLQQVDVKLVSAQECDDVYGNVSEQNFCAGTVTEGQDSCRGDSGGPIIVKETGEQLGWVSWGDQYCGRAGSYGVYADAGYFQPWLSQFTTGLSYTQNQHIGYYDLSTFNHTFSFSNTGSEVIEFTSFSLTEVNGAAATIQSNSCSGQVLLGGETCSIEAQLSVDTYREYSSALVIDYVVDSETINIASTVNYEGVMQAEQALKDVLSFDFDNVYVNGFTWLPVENGIRSAPIDDNQQSVIVIEGIPQGSITLDLKVSSENGFDVLEARINDTDLGAVSGEEQYSTNLTLPQQTNTLRFAFIKDGSTSAGDDSAVITNMRFSTSTSGGSDGGSGGSINGFWLLLLGLPLARQLKQRLSRYS